MPAEVISLGESVNYGAAEDESASAAAPATAPASSDLSSAVSFDDVSSLPQVGTTASTTLPGGVKVSVPRDPAPRNKDIAKYLQNPEDVRTNQRLRIALGRYNTSPIFAQHLVSCGFHLNPSALKSLDNDELDCLLQRVRVTCQSMNSSDSLERMIFAATSMIEHASQQNPKIKSVCDLRGFTQALQGSAQVKQSIELVRLENGDLLQLPPVIGLIVALAQTAASVNLVNRYVRRRMKRPGEGAKQEGEEEEEETKEEKDTSSK